jgi:hypothetical protein
MTPPLPVLPQVVLLIQKRLIDKELSINGILHLFTEVSVFSSLTPFTVPTITLLRARQTFPATGRTPSAPH